MPVILIKCYKTKMRYIIILDQTEGAKEAKEKKEKKLTLADMERKVILEKEGIFPTLV